MASDRDHYLAFARETAGRSPGYEALSLAVAGDPLILGFLASLPEPKRQPNLLFAAARYLLDEPAHPGTLERLVRERPDELSRVMLARRTQTNEPARCATLLPALAQLPEPLAIIEVGASAGLTLLFDRYSYDYDGHRVTGTDPSAPVLRCAVGGPVPLPRRVPAISWRAGLDLNPLDVRREEDVHWLRCLIWPGEGDRAERLRTAVETARRDPPPVHRGDLLTDLPALAARAPADATLVVYHSSVLAYVAKPDRGRFAEHVRELRKHRRAPVVWLSNEAPGVVPGVPAPEGAGTLLADLQYYLQIRDGTVPLAVADGHGAALHWLK